MESDVLKTLLLNDNRIDAVDWSSVRTKIARLESFTISDVRTLILF